MSRITRALLALALLALVAPGSAAAAATLVPVADFDSPIAAASPPRDPTRLFVVERGGRVWVVRNGTKVRDAVPRHRRPGRDRRRARAAVDRLRTGLRGLRALLRLPDRRGAARRAAGARVPPLGGRPRPRRADRPDRLEHAARRGEQPQRRPGRDRAGRDAVVRDRRRRRQQRSVQPRARPREPRSASCCGSIRTPATAAATRSPPTTRSAPRSGPTACATRSASPSTSAARATSSSATSARARARRSTGLPTPRASGAAPTTGGRASRGRSPGRGPAARTRATWGRSGSTRRPSPRAVTGGYRRARPGPAVAVRPLRLRGHLQGVVQSFVPGRPVADRRAGRPACRSATCSSPSPRTPAATST